VNQALLDTDTLSEILRAKNATVLRNADAYRQEFGRHTISTISIVEVVQGFARLGHEHRIADFNQRISAHEVLPLGQSAALIAGRMYGGLLRAGQNIGRADCLIAAIAVRHGITLISGNLEHYERIVHLGFPLTLANWRD
jgi:tRNA(fMet)-specific endonuclease VapC